MKTLCKVVLGGVALLGSVTANAALIVTPGGGDVGTNLISNVCVGTVTGPATTVQGCLNTDHSIFINLTSDENLEISGGQATLVAEDGAFSFLEISMAMAGWTFSTLQLNIDALEDGFVTFFGTPGGTSPVFALDANGENRFTITGEDFSSLSFTTTSAIGEIDLVGDVKQIRLTVDGPADVPEPSGLALLGMALLGLVRKTRASSLTRS